MVKQNKYVKWAEKKAKEVWNNITKPKKKTPAQKSKTQQKRKPNQKSVSLEEIAAWVWGKAKDGARWAGNKINSVPLVKSLKNMMKARVIDQKPLKGAQSKASEQKIKQAYLHDPERSRRSSKALSIKEALAQRNLKNLYALPIPQRKPNPEVVAYYKRIKVNEESQKAARQLNSTLLGSLPIIGGLKNGAEFIIGHDIATGEKISRGETVLGAATGGLSKLYKLSKSSGFNQFNKNVPQASQGQGTGNSMPPKQSKPTQGIGNPSPEQLLGIKNENIPNTRGSLYKKIPIRAGVSGKPQTRNLKKWEIDLANQILDDIAAQARGDGKARERLKALNDHVLENRTNIGGQNYTGWNSVYIRDKDGNNGVMRIIYKQTSEGIK